MRALILLMAMTIVACEQNTVVTNQAQSATNVTGAAPGIDDTALPVEQVGNTVAGAKSPNVVNVTVKEETKAPPCKSGAIECKPWERNWGDSGPKPGDVILPDGTIRRGTN